MDRITESLLNTFKTEQSLSEELSESIIFEHFANYCTLAKEYNESFSLEDVHTSGGNDIGIDGIAIIINGTLITSTEEVNDLSQSNRYLEVEFIFIQAKRSSRFEAGAIATFLLGVKEFFSETPTMPRNNTIIQKSEIMELIYQKSSLFRKGNPLCKMFYVTTGNWCDDPHLKAVIESSINDLRSLQIFRSVEFNPVDANKLQHLYKYSQNKIIKQIKFEKRTVLPEIDGVREAYIGTLPAKEYLKLITDDSNNIIRGLFYDNVRDYQGNNDVNLEIQDTITSGNHEEFVLFNNGITIVAEQLNLVGDRADIEDYQIVNGYQTSHVLYRNRDNITDQIHLPIKLIVLDNNEIKNKIIKATNRQTPVKSEELEALTDFQKKLEEYYASFSEDKKLFYERRPKQFNGINGIEKIRIVTISTQIRCFSSMFLDQAHNAGHYYGRILDFVKGKIFVNDQNTIGYYISAYTNFRLYSFLRRKQIDGKYKPFRYHMLNIFRMQEGGKQMPLMNSNKFIKYCEKMEQVLWDDTKCLKAFKKATSVIDTVVNEDYNREVAKRKGLLESIKNVLG